MPLNYKLSTNYSNYMKMFKRLFILFVFVFAQNSLSAQTSSENSANTVNQVLPLENVSNSNSGTVLTAPQTTVEPTLTPEQQGFTKYMIDGKPVYYKKTENLIIEYKPNN